MTLIVWLSWCDAAYDARRVFDLTFACNAWSQVHTGHVKLKAAAPKTPLLVSFRVCPLQDSYGGSERNGLSSRTWSAAHGGVSIKVERCLQHTAGSMPAPELSMLRPGPTRMIPGSMQAFAPGPGQSFATPLAANILVFNLSNEPCLCEVRSAPCAPASPLSRPCTFQPGALRRRYSLALVADQGAEEERWTSTQLRPPPLSQHTRPTTDPPHTH